MLCYYHRDILEEKLRLTGDQMFCNDEEHKKWSDKYYGKNGGKKEKTIKQIQERCMELAEQVRQEKRNKKYELVGMTPPTEPSQVWYAK